MKAFSIDLRQRILDAYDAGEGTRQEIADRYSVSLAMVKKLLVQRKATGSIEPIPKPGRTPIFHGKLLEELDAYMRERPDATLEEIRGHLYQGIALNASEQGRPDVAQQCARWRAEQGEMESRGLGFLDEAGAKTNMTRLRARVKGGARAYDSVPAGRWSTTTMISSLRLDGRPPAWYYRAPRTEGAFVEYVRSVLVPTLRPGDVVVMDNLSSHKGPTVCELIETCEATLVYLPAYSPDFNPIEKMWSKVKELLRGAKARSEEALLKAIGMALKRTTPKTQRAGLHHVVTLYDELL